MAYKRYLIGAADAFDSTYDADPSANQYTSYPMGNETEQYSEAPFSGVQQDRKFNIFKFLFFVILTIFYVFPVNQDYQAPTY